MRPKNRILSALGVYFCESVLSREETRALSAHIRASVSGPATLYSDREGVHINEVTRKSSRVEVDPSWHLLVQSRLDAVKPELEQYFDRALSGDRELLDFLRYDSGDFFGAHVDSPRGAAPDDALVRRVSIVLFVNEDYEGGELRFFNLIDDDPAWRDVGMACEAEPGLLVAFRSHLMHEVTPVTRGSRCTIATWFR